MQIFAYAPADDVASANFFDDVHFTKFGVLPRYFKRRTDDAPVAGDKYEGVDPTTAALWVSVLRGNELVEYKRPAAAAGSRRRGDDEEGDLDLTTPDIAKLRVKRMPKWLRDILLQFLLPIGIVGVIFIVSYLLVVLGPLEGIGEKEWFKSVVRMPRPTTAPEAGGGSGAHSFDSPDEYDEL